MYSLLNTVSEYTHFYISKNITSYTFLLVFKFVESLQCVLKGTLMRSENLPIYSCSYKKNIPVKFAKCLFTSIQKQ